MGPDPAVLGLLEGESEGVEHLGCAEPHELVGAGVDIDSERFGLRVAEARIDSVSGDNQIIVRPARVGRVALDFEMQPRAEFDRARGHNLEQALAADADKAVTR